MMDAAMETITVSEFARWNDEMFVRYGNERLYFHSNKIIRHIQQCRVRTIASYLQLAPADRLLDAGTGEGYLFSKLPRVAKQVGIDISERALCIARAKEYENVTFLQADASRLPFPDASFDKIICSEVIEHVLEPKKVLYELERVLHPGGRLVITIPYERHLNMVKDVFLSSSLGRHYFNNLPRRTEWHRTFYSPALLEDQLKDQFKITKKSWLPNRLLPLGLAVCCERLSS